MHNLSAAKAFYGGILKLPEGRSSEKWQDYDLYGNQLVCHVVGEEYRNIDYFNPVDNDEVPVAHFGACLSSEAFDELANRLIQAGVRFIIEPHLRFKGQPGEQKTMFFKDPSNNNMEFKSMSNPSSLFDKDGQYYTGDDYKKCLVVFEKCCSYVGQVGSHVVQSDFRIPTGRISVSCKFEFCYKNTFYYAILKLYYDKHTTKYFVSANEIYICYKICYK